MATAQEISERLAALGQRGATAPIVTPGFYGSGVGVTVQACEIESHGTYWECYAEDGEYLATFEDLPDMMKWARAMEAQLLVQTQAWYQANEEELTK